MALSKGELFMREDIMTFFKKITGDESLVKRFNTIKTASDVESIIEDTGFDFSVQELKEAIETIESLSSTD
jgi:predicted ribosomally synthesized peptide with nif11-like leader